MQTQTPNHRHHHPPCSIHLGYTMSLVELPKKRTEELSSFLSSFCRGNPLDLSVYSVHRRTSASASARRCRRSEAICSRSFSDARVLCSLSANSLRSLLGEQERKSIWRFHTSNFSGHFLSWTLLLFLCLPHRHPTERASPQTHDTDSLLFRQKTNAEEKSARGQTSTDGCVFYPRLLRLRERRSSWIK